jgi:hypothetical protein
MSATIPSKTLGVLRRKKIKNRLKICIVLSPYAESNHGPLHYLVYSFFNILSIYYLTTMESLFFRIVLPNPITNISLHECLPFSRDRKPSV